MEESQPEVRTRDSWSPKGTHAAVAAHGIPLRTGSEAMQKAFWPEWRAENQLSHHMPVLIPSAWFHCFPLLHPQQLHSLWLSTAPLGCHPVPSWTPALLGSLPVWPPSGTGGALEAVSSFEDELCSEQHCYHHQ